tara:strand:+ start:438 stop:746 length:309 start_codon:yes stop_codon:yes gene_type:complete
MGFFHPELFECRSRAVEALEEGGFAWMSHYGSVDILHQEYGLEVCGIHQQDDAGKILDILRKLFPDWIYAHAYYEDYGREMGWRALLYQHPDSATEDWKDVG